MELFENTVLDFTAEDSVEAMRDRLAGLLAQYGFDLADRPAVR